MATTAADVLVGRLVDWGVDSNQYAGWGLVGECVGGRRHRPPARRLPMGSDRLTSVVDRDCGS